MLGSGTVAELLVAAAPSVCDHRQPSLERLRRPTVEARLVAGSELCDGGGRSTWVDVAGGGDAADEVKAGG